jgi:sporulation protein YlmC with PRC-barrel domain
MTNRFVPTSRLKVYDVTNASGEDLGQVQNFMVDMVTGKITLVIVAFGGFLGISDKWLAIPFEKMVWRPSDMKFILNVPREVLENAQGIDKDKWPADVTAEWLESVYMTYGCAPYWKEQIGKIFHTGQKVEQSGIYEYVYHVDSECCTPDCQPTEAEFELPLSRGETFPPIRSCGKGAAWRLVRAA